jgi:SAM-dependent methyltransferase
VLSQETLDSFGKEYDLSYQLGFLNIIDSVHPLKGLRVMEIGGSNLPRALVLDQLGAKQWICVDDLKNFDLGKPRAMSDAMRNHHDTVRKFTAHDAAAEILVNDYAIIDGDICSLDIFDYFDAVVSIAAFEHILKFGGLLDRAHDALRPEGHLLSMFQPIWSCVNGHHLWGIKDKAGHEYNFASGIVPYWGHLLLTPPQLRRDLLTKTDADCADDIVSAVYNSPNINRLFFEDYVDYMNASRFRLKKVTPMGQIVVPEQVQAALEAAHPGRTCFDANTVFIHAVK